MIDDFKTSMAALVLLWIVAAAPFFIAAIVASRRYRKRNEPPRELIDRKFMILAINPSKRPIVAKVFKLMQFILEATAGTKRGGVYTSKDAVLFLAKDQIFISSLFEYARRCRIVLGRDNLQTKGAYILLDRVKNYQRTQGSRNPDVEVGLEAATVIQDGGIYPKAVDAAGGFDGTGIER